MKSGNDYSFTEENNEILKYDLNGNIDNLKRFSYKVGTVPSKIDDLDYRYTGNRLTSIDDTSLDGNGYEGGDNTIDYDANGNMTNMLDKGINSIAYNHLNLPNAMDMGSGKRKSSNSSIYRSDGTKLKRYILRKVREYLIPGSLPYQPLITLTVFSISRRHLPETVLQMKGWTRIMTWNWQWRERRSRKKL